MALEDKSFRMSLLPPWSKKKTFSSHTSLSRCLLSGLGAPLCGFPAAPRRLKGSIGDGTGRGSCYRSVLSSLLLIFFFFMTLKRRPQHDQSDTFYTLMFHQEFSSPVQVVSAPCWKRQEALLSTFPEFTAHFISSG